MADPLTDNIIIIKTGSLASFTMQYSDDQDPAEGISLVGYDIHIDFINPKTRVPLSRTAFGYGIEFSEGDVGELQLVDTPIKTIDDGGKYMPAVTSVADDPVIEGQYKVNAGSTLNWPLGDIPVDIKYINGGVAQHTETFILRVEKGLSQ